MKPEHGTQLPIPTDGEYMLLLGVENAKLRETVKDLLEACRHGAVSFHHPNCKCKGEYSANPERYCTCHVYKCQAAIAKAEGRT